MKRRDGSVMARLLAGALLLAALQVYSLEVEVTGRACFVRGETDARLGLSLKNPGEAAVAAAPATWEGKPIELPALAAGETKVIQLPVETNLFPGSYQATLVAGGETRALDYRIGPQLSKELPVILWGFKGDHKELMKLGFNHGYTYGIWGESPEHPTRLDDALADGFRYIGGATTNVDKELRQSYLCVNREGKQLGSVDASNPVVATRMLDWVEKTTGMRSHPAIDGVCVNSETRASTRPSFAPHQIQAWKEFSGRDVPEEVNERGGVHYRQIKDFPEDRVVPENYPLLEYYRWFWRKGDGWNDLNTRMVEALHKGASPDFVCFHDPVIRTAPIWGSGGNVDAVNHWTYAYPEPFRIASHIQSILAMTHGLPKPKPWAMTQLISYRSRITNTRVQPDPLPEWAVKTPIGDYISTPPDSLQEAVWTMAAHPIQAILFHGQGSIQPMKITKSDPRRGYYCTNDGSALALQKVLTEVVRPLSPMLRELPPTHMRIAILQSFASSMLAGRGTWGWGGWPDDLSLIMHYAGMDSGVLYDESILAGGLDGVKILAMPHCDVLTEEVVRRVHEFQLKGGIVIGDPVLCPAIVPQVLVQEFSRKGDAEAVQARLLRNANTLRRELNPFLAQDSETDQPELIRFSRYWKSSAYHFVINDKRQYGDYVGKAWKVILDDGAPNAGNLKLRSCPGAVYELSRGGKAEYRREGEGAAIPMEFTTNDGRIFLTMEKPIERVTLELPEQVVPGGDLVVIAKVLDASGKPVEALLPVRFSITDGKGRLMDGGPYACAVDGVFAYRTKCPLNASGSFAVKISDRASGLEATGTIKIVE